ncbi:MAG TPA: FCD domain-containing protein [Burkholderiales bacterium]|nr:FCD domain-containing protein [Burkholderiales bacterium]
MLPVEPSTAAGSAPSLGLIYVPKSCDLLADRLRTQILDGTIADGAALPAERDLVLQTGLSRGSVREALRILQTEGLVMTRPGRLGGSVARRPGDDAMARYVGMFVQGRGISLLSLLQTREAIGPKLAALAARNRNDEDLDALLDATRRVEDAFADVPVYLAENVNWHRTVAVASHNELLKSFVVAISDLVYKASAIENFANDDVRNLVIKAHRRIADAIAAQDAEAAERRMARHLTAITQQMQAFVQTPLVLR